VQLEGFPNQLQTVGTTIETIMPVGTGAIKRFDATHTALFSPLAGETEAVVSYLQEPINANELA
jgi:hypothetical protein